MYELDGWGMSQLIVVTTVIVQLNKPCNEKSQSNSAASVQRAQNEMHGTMEALSHKEITPPTNSRVQMHLHALSALFLRESYAVPMGRKTLGREQALRI